MVAVFVFCPRVPKESWGQKGQLISCMICFLKAVVTVRMTLNEQSMTLLAQVCVHTVVYMNASQKNIGKLNNNSRLSFEVSNVHGVGLVPL